MKEKDLSEALRTKNASWQGWYVGPTAEVGFPLGFKAELSFCYAHHELEVEQGEMQVNYLSVPLNLKLNFGLPKLAAAFIGGGPQYDFRINDDIGLLENVVGEQKVLKRENGHLSWNVGGGLRLMDHLQIAIYYHLPMTKDDAENVESVYQNGLNQNTWKGSVTLFF